MSGVSLFLHSTATTPSLWDGVPADVLAGTEKIAPSNLGYPPHPALGRGTACDAGADAANAISALPDHGDVHVFAHSYGGVIALAVAERLGARVRSLFLYEPVMFGALARDEGASDPEAVADARTFMNHEWFLDDAHGGSAAWLEVFIDYWNRPGAFANMPAPMRAFVESVSWKMYQEVRSCFFDVTSFDLPVLRRAPTTLVMGERSPRASRAMAKAVARVNPTVRLVELPKTGHMAPLTHAPLVHAAMLEHVRTR